MTSPQTRVFLQPGTLYCGDRPCEIVTILGSCVAVALWDFRLGRGGLTHSLLPSIPIGHRCSARFVGCAVEMLIALLLRSGGVIEHMRAKLFGGGAVLDAQGPGQPIGERNLAAAEAALRQWSIPLVACCPGGRHGLLVKANTASQSVLVRRLNEAKGGSHAIR